MPFALENIPSQIKNMASKVPSIKVYEIVMDFFANCSAILEQLSSAFFEGYRLFGLSRVDVRHLAM